MRAGRFFVDRRLSQWFSEYGQYHYKDNKIVKVHDHLLDATRVAWMMRRRAQAVPLGSGKPQRRRSRQGQDINPWTGKVVQRHA